MQSIVFCQPKEKVVLFTKIAFFFVCLFFGFICNKKYSSAIFGFLFTYQPSTARINQQIAHCSLIKLIMLHRCKRSN